MPRRHPFDVLISILQYATHVHDTRPWLAARGATSRRSAGLDPNHADFLAYACGPRARALLAVSPEWSRAPGAVPIRYEDLVASPGPTLRGLADALGQPPVIAWDDALAANTMDALRKTHGFGHIWKGRPGLWRDSADPRVGRAPWPRPIARCSTAWRSAELDPAPSSERAMATWQGLNVRPGVGRSGPASMRGRRLVLAAAVLFSVAGVVDEAARPPAASIAVYRSLFAGLALLAVVSPRRWAFRPSRSRSGSSSGP